MDLFEHDYKAVSVPIGCTEYEVDNVYPFWVIEPPPLTLTVPCAGTTLRAEFSLVED